MVAQYTIECVNSVIEVHATGLPDRQSVSQMWKDIINACEEHECMSILGTTNMERPLKLADAIDHQAIFHEAGVTIDHRIAWVQLNPAAYEMTQLVETVLLNRGLVNGRLFTDEIEARRWLEKRG
ncbi:MAG: hypothetical protein OER91_00130 [Gammaproteobacteria bacterium]|nr:hypothetical protein [Gammaproteobacteria bacterium]